MPGVGSGASLSFFVTCIPCSLPLCMLVSPFPEWLEPGRRHNNEGPLQCRVPQAQKPLPQYVGISAPDNGRSTSPAATYRGPSPPYPPPHPSNIARRNESHEAGTGYTSRCAVLLRYMASSTEVVVACSSVEDRSDSLPAGVIGAVHLPHSLDLAFLLPPLTRSCSCLLSRRHSNQRAHGISSGLR